MSLNQFMNPRNPFYKNPPDFKALAQIYPDLAKCMRVDKPLDFKDPETVRAVAATLLKHIYNLNVKMPLDHLIPRVPQRINYILWIEDLLGRPESAHGIDIGCGASCVFALIACAANPCWKMLCSDISIDNVRSAQINIDANSLKERIHVEEVDRDVFVIKLLEIVDATSGEESRHDYDFLMCNPPFYEDEAELGGASKEPRLVRRPEKRRASIYAANTSQHHEAIYAEGGEVGFVRKIVDESVQIGKRIKMFTSMFGKKSSWMEVKEYLKAKGILNVSETQFCQGRTMRWAIAWSFHDKSIFELHQCNYFTKPKSKVQNVFKEFVYQLSSAESVKFADTKSLYDFVKTTFVADLKFTLLKEDIENYRLKMNVSEDTWSNQRQKRRRTASLEGNENDVAELNKRLDCEFNFEVQIEKVDEIGAGTEPCLKLTFVSLSDNTPITRENLHRIIQFSRNRLDKIVTL